MKKWIVRFIVAVTITWLFVLFSGTGTPVSKMSRISSLEILMRGEAERPFVYRQLIPKAVWALDKISLQSGFKPENSVYLRVLAVYYNSKPKYGLAALWASLVVLICLLGFMDALARLANSLAIPFEPAIAVAFLIIFFRWGCLYDFALLWLFTLAYWAMVERRWRTYLAVFTLSCFNKETTILLLVPFIAWFWGAQKERPYRLMVAQVGIYVVIRGGLMWVYRLNPGEVMEYHWPEILEQYRLFVWFFGPVLGPTGAYLLYQLYHAPKNRFLACASSLFWVLLPLHLIWGYPFEWRVFYEVYPILLLLVAQVWSVRPVLIALVVTASVGLWAGPAMAQALDLLPFVGWFMFNFLAWVALAPLALAVYVWWNRRQFNYPKIA